MRMKSPAASLNFVNSKRRRADVADEEVEMASKQAKVAKAVKAGRAGRVGRAVKVAKVAVMVEVEVVAEETGVVYSIPKKMNFHRTD